MTLSPVIVMAAADTVAIARADLAAGTELPDLGITCREPIPRGGKVATVALAEGASIRRYGEVIGLAARTITPGEHVHTHNVATNLPHRSAEDSRGMAPARLLPPDQRERFLGYRRPDGRVGTRNYVAVVSSVNCSATVVRMIAAAAEQAEWRVAFPQVDGVIALTLPTGCGMAGAGEGFDLLRRTLYGYLTHPNLGAALLVGLGCEVNTTSSFCSAFGLTAGPAFHVLNIQNEGGTRATIARGIEVLRSLFAEAARQRREPVSVEHLVVGLQCGGSDSYSGFTANPALGAAVDRLVARGGTAVLSETPEIYGAEHVLVRRAVSPAVGDALMARIRWWQAYAARHGAQLNDNPSPGNKAGGLTTIFEKSLGAIAKGGGTALVDIYGYAEQISASGLVFMDTPGFDPCSATGQIAGGCNLIAFTTGRGSVSGFRPVPCLKIATNTQLYQAMGEDMDLNCGTIADGFESVDVVGERIFRRLIEVASGEVTASEKFGFGQQEFVPWQIGAVL